MRRILSCMAVLLALVMAGAAGAEEDTDLTLMVYMTGSNLESDAGMASADMEEMCAALGQTPASLHVLVMTGGAFRWQNGVSAEETAIYRLTAAGREKVCALPLMSMGEPDTLTRFLDYCYEAFPARQYALILWDHGGGPMQGVCFDELCGAYGSWDALLLPELDTALANSPFAREKLSWIGFDACLMSSLETARLLVPYAETMIASEETEPAQGWDYGFLASLTGNESGEETGRIIIDAYMDAHRDTFSPVTLSCVRLPRVEALCEAVGSLFADLAQTVDISTYSALAQNRAEVKSMACAASMEMDLIDLSDMVSYYEDARPEACAALNAAFGEAVAYHRTNTRFLSGLSLYYPFYNKNAYRIAWADRLRENAAAEGYSAFIARMADIWLGEALTVWREILPAEACEEEGVSRISLQLTPEEAQHYAGAQLMIFREDLDNELLFVYATRDVVLDRDNRLTARYGGESLVLVDEAGEPATGSLTYMTTREGLIVPAILSRGGFLEILPVRLICLWDEKGNPRLSEVISVDADRPFAGKTTVSLDEWDEIYIYCSGLGGKPARSESGRLLPRDQWEKAHWTIMETWDLRKPWSLRFVPQYSTERRFALFEITDTQNCSVLSDLAPLDNPNRLALPVEEQLLVDNEYCRIACTGAELALGPNGGVELLLTCESRAERTLLLSEQQIYANDTYAVGSSYTQRIPPAGTVTLRVYLPADNLRMSRVRLLRSVSMELRVSPDYSNDNFSAGALFSLPVTMRLEADLTALTGEPEPLVLSSALAWRGLDIELYNVSADAAGGLTGLAHIANRTDAEILFSTTLLASADAARYEGRLLGNDFQIALPAGRDIYTRMSIIPREEEIPPAPGTAIHEISFGVYNDARSDGDTIVFRLSEPLIVPES